MPDCSIIEREIRSIQGQIHHIEMDVQNAPSPEWRLIYLSILENKRDVLRRLEETLINCQAGLPSSGIRQTQGRVFFLRVSELGDAFGPRGDSIKAEVVFKLDTQPGRVFGFRLEDDENRPVREGMLSSLRESLINKLIVLIDYDQKTGAFNSITKSVALSNAEGSTFLCASVMDPKIKTQA